MIDGQLDLFADAGEPVSDRERWAARFERAPWSWPYATGYGADGRAA